MLMNGFVCGYHDVTRGGNGKKTINHTQAGFLSNQMNFLGTVSFTIEQQMCIAWQYCVKVYVSQYVYSLFVGQKIFIL